MTRNQTILLQVARRALRLDDDAYRFVLHNVAGVESSKDLTNRQFEEVMAVLEDKGFRQPGQPADRWRNKTVQRPVFADARQIHRIRQLATSTKYSLEGLVRRFSHDRTDQPTKLRPREASQLIDMLTAAAARSTSGMGASPMSSRGTGVPPVFEPPSFPEEPF